MFLFFLFFQVKETRECYIQTDFDFKKASVSRSRIRDWESSPIQTRQNKLFTHTNIESISPIFNGKAKRKYRHLKKSDISNVKHRRGKSAPPNKEKCVCLFSQKYFYH